MWCAQWRGWAPEPGRHCDVLQDPLTREVGLGLGLGLAMELGSGPQGPGQGRGTGRGLMRLTGEDVARFQRCESQAAGIQLQPAAAAARCGGVNKKSCLQRSKFRGKPQQQMYKLL